MNYRKVVGTAGVVVGGFAVVAGVVWWFSDARKDGTSLLAFIKNTTPFAAGEFTPADYEEMYIESSGVTADEVPVSLAQAFMGYKFLDLEHTSAVINDMPFGDGLIDVKPVYVNPYDLGYTLDAEEIRRYDAEDNPVAEMNRTFNALAPGQGESYQPSSMHNCVKLQNSIEPESLDNAWQGSAGITYSGYREPCCKVPPEVNHDFPYLVSMIDAPFPVVLEAYDGSNRFGSLSRNSTDDSVNGRTGKLALSPDADAFYTATGGVSNQLTKTLSEWRIQYTILRYTDTTVKAIPRSGGEELMLMRV